VIGSLQDPTNTKPLAPRRPPWHCRLSRSPDVHRRRRELSLSTCWRAIIAALAPKSRRDEILIKALVRAYRWRRQIESGRAKSITDLAEQESITDAYICRLLPLTCLAPDIVEAILDGRQPKGLRLAELLGNGPVAWEEQRGAWRFSL
jgi:hypothetical protein